MKMKFNNQKLLTIHRETVKNGGARVFLTAYTDNIVCAMQTLTPSAFKVYLLLLMNKDKYDLWLSPAYIGERAHIHRDTARKCIYELENVGYIVMRNDGVYDFYENPYPYNDN
jgi:hypothetical protein